MSFISEQVRSLSAFLDRILQIFRYSSEITVSPDETQPYLESTEPFGLISLKSIIIFLAGYCPASNLPIDLAQASPESPTMIFQIPFSES